MSENKELMRGTELNIPETESLRAKFTEITLQFGSDVPVEVQGRMLGACTTPQAKLELLDHLVVSIGMPVTAVISQIRLASHDTQKLAMRVHYVRARLRREAAAKAAAESKRVSSSSPLFIAPATDATSKGVVYA